MVKKLEVLVLGGLLGVPCVIILSKCAASPSLFAVHPAANAVAFLVCFPLGLYVMLERKRITNFRTRVLLVQTHLFSHVVAMLCLSIGGVAAFLTKNTFGKEHLTSTHSWVAVVTSLLSALNLFGGLVTTFGGKKTRWQWKDWMHRANGTLAVMAGGCSVILGIYSGTWGTTQLGEDLQVKVASSVAAAYLLLFLKVAMNSSKTSLTKVSD
ncbi:unnamed protein product [Hyaloperonospora brassicae]|uniref:Cytochrome b561 domain-containing protein n=1 Tax=Hyaloperonospora brassicae TaxID=162125 RepID=A0AAV0ULS7_HYABA|nr:unnamed protein product [Hyaloperonospora brassicae]